MRKWSMSSGMVTPMGILDALTLALRMWKVKAF